MARRQVTKEELRLMQRERLLYCKVYPLVRLYRERTDRSWQDLDTDEGQHFEDCRYLGRLLRVRDSLMRLLHASSPIV